jgi:hypothetical protein
MGARLDYVFVLRRKLGVRRCRSTHEVSEKFGTKAIAASGGSGVEA